MRLAIQPFRLIPILAAALAITAWPASRAAAQFPPARLKNVKVLPRTMTVSALVDTMRSFTRALGVRCTYCHDGREGQPLDSIDFASDRKPEKEIARRMLRMVRDVNEKHLARLPTRVEPAITVGCATCHRGVTEPRPIQQVILAAYGTAGIDSAESIYRALRTRYFGRAAYDFGDVPLVDVANALAKEGHVADALRLHVLNTSLLPGSFFASWQAGEAYVAAGDTARARELLRRALELNPRRADVRGRLEQLGDTLRR